MRIKFNNKNINIKNISTLSGEFEGEWNGYYFMICPYDKNENGKTIYECMCTNPLGELIYHKEFHEIKTKQKNCNIYSITMLHTTLMN